MFKSRPFAVSGRDKQTQASGPIERVGRHRQGSLCRNETGVSHLRTSRTWDLVDEVNSLRLRLRDGLCDPAEQDVVQGCQPKVPDVVRKGVEAGLARHRRSALRAGWILPVPPLFHFVNNAPRYTGFVEHLLAEMNLTQ
jgi:hypothetical protein